MLLCKAELGLTMQQRADFSFGIEETTARNSHSKLSSEKNMRVNFVPRDKLGPIVPGKGGRVGKHLRAGPDSECRRLSEL